MNITPADYLSSQNIKFVERHSELLFNCPFGDCDQGKTPASSHCYMNAENGQYYCQKCSAKGNLVTLATHFGDEPSKFRQYQDPLHIVRSVREKAKEIDVSLPASEAEKWHAALPSEILHWLKTERGLTSEVIENAKLGWDGERLIIPIPDQKGNWLFAKRRLPPGKEDSGPKYLYPAGAKAALFGIEFLKDTDQIIICEGELDALTLRSLGIPAVTSTGGAGTFEDSWTELFSKIEKVYIVYDNDPPGMKGALKVAGMIPQAKIAYLPAEVGDKGDITDFFIKLSKTPDDFGKLLKSAISLKDLEERGDRYKPLPRPESEIGIAEWRALVATKFPECLAAGEVGLSVIAQLLIQDVRNPFGLVYVDVPSAGKTITLNFFSEIAELTYPTDSFTPSSLVSHATNRKREDLAKIDLLPRIRFKTLIVRDLAPIFAERQENLLKNLGVLTRVFDGEGYESDSGVHGKRGYRGDYTFMFLAGSTPIAPRVWKFMGNLGSRLFFLNLNVPDKSEEELADLLAQDDFKQKEKDCRVVTRDAVLTTWSKHPNGIAWDKLSDPPELRRIVARSASLLAHLRGTVNVWTEEDGGEKTQHHTNVIIEKPMRLNQLLYNLARGHAVVCGRTQLTEEDMWPVIEVILNSAQYNRIKLLEAIMANGGTITTGIAESSINCSNPTALKEIETLRILGLVETQEEKVSSYPGRPEKIVTLKKEFEWFCSKECKRLRAMRPG